MAENDFSEEFLRGLVSEFDKWRTKSLKEISHDMIVNLVSSNDKVMQDVFGKWSDNYPLKKSLKDANEYLRDEFFGTIENIQEKYKKTIEENRIKYQLDTRQMQQDLHESYVSSLKQQAELALKLDGGVFRGRKKEIQDVNKMALDAEANLYDKVLKLRSNRITKEQRERYKLTDEDFDKYKAAELAKRRLSLDTFEIQKKVIDDEINREHQLYSEIEQIEARIQRRRTGANAGERELQELLNYQKRVEAKQLADEKEYIDIRSRRSFFSSGEEGHYTRMETLVKLGETLIKHIIDDINRYVDIMIMNPFKSGVSNFNTQYEANFTELAGRLGNNLRQETHQFITSTLDEINGDSNLKHGLNFANDVLPELVNATKAGFKGSEAQQIAIYNSIDKKIMPWLNTSSDLWQQLQFSLADDTLKQIKGQELLLQETREGNRILQQGIAEQIRDYLAPSLLNIESNTTNVTDLSAQSQAIVAYLMDRGYSKSDALSYAKDVLDAYQNPYSSITGSSVSNKLMGIEALNGGDLTDLVRVYGNLAGNFVGTGPIGMGAAQAYLGLNFGNYTRTDDNARDLAEAYEGIQQYIAEFTGDNTKLLDVYTNRVNSLNQTLSATSSYDNNVENIAAGITAYFINKPHGVDVFSLILDEVSDIKTWLIKDLFGTFISDQFTMLRLGRRLSGGAGTSNPSIISNALTGGGGFANASTLGTGAAKNAAGRGYGLLNGGLTGALAQGGSQLTGGMASGTGAFAVGAGTTLAGLGIGIYGGKTIAGTVANWNGDPLGKNSKATDNGMGLLTGGAMLAGGAGMAAAGLGLVSGPVGWIGLAVASLGLLGKTVYESATKIGGATDDINAAFGSVRQELTNFQSDQIKSLTGILNDLTNNTKTQNDLNLRRNELISSGLLTQEDEKKARVANTEELKKLTQEYIKSSAVYNYDVQSRLNRYSNESKNWSNDVMTSFSQKLEDQQWKNGDNEDFVEIAGLIANYAYTDLENQLAGGVEFDKDTKKLYDKLKKALSDGWDAKDTSVFSNGSQFRKAKFTADALNSMVTTMSGFTDNEFAQELLNSITSSNYSYHDPNDLGNALLYLSPAIKATSPEDAKNWLNQFKAAGFKLKDYRNERDELREKYGDTFIKGYKIGSSYIPEDQLAELHKGERVLTAEQNKVYTETLLRGGLSTLSDVVMLTSNLQHDNKESFKSMNNVTNDNIGIIQSGISDVVAAIKNQTSEIVNAISNISISGPQQSSFSMLPVMGNTRMI